MDGRFGEAMAIQNRLVPLHDALFSETSPAPVKFAASLLGKTSERCRLPLAPIMDAHPGEGACGDDRCGVAELTHRYPYRHGRLAPAIHVCRDAAQ